VINLNPIIDLFLLDLGKLVRITEKLPWWAIRDRGYNSNFTAIESGEVKHPLLDKDGIVRLEVIWEESGIDKNFHDLS